MEEKKYDFKRMILLILFSQLLMSRGILAQQKNSYLGIGIETLQSMNGHGSFFSGFLSLNNKSWTCKLGPLIQKRFMGINGVKFSYSHVIAKHTKNYIFADEIRPVEGPFRLNAFSFAQYVHRGRLSYFRAREESFRNPENKTNWSDVRLSTLEVGLGFELLVKINQKLHLNSFVGISVYHHTDYFSGMYHEKAAPSLVFGAGINIPKF